MPSVSIRTLSVGLASALFASTPADAQQFVDRAHGFSIEKPADWCVLSTEAITQDHRTIGAANPALREALRNSPSLPTFAFTRYAASSRALTDTVKVGTVPSASLEGQSGQQILESMLPAIRNILPKVGVDTAPEAVRLAGKTAGHMRLTYMLQTPAGAQRIASETWVIPHEGFYLQVGATYPPDEPRDRAAVMEVVNSLRLTS
jgi:hypothetical protein